MAGDTKDSNRAAYLPQLVTSQMMCLADSQELAYTSVSQWHVPVTTTYYWPFYTSQAQLLLNNK